jgi:hypothetical protein
MLPSHSPFQAAGAPHAEADPDTLDALVDSSRRLVVFWPQLEAGAQPDSAPGGPITVPARTRELVAGMPEYGL